MCTRRLCTGISTVIFTDRGKRNVGNVFCGIYAKGVDSRADCSVICPLIGSFLVLRRQSMIGDGAGAYCLCRRGGRRAFGGAAVVSAALATVAGALVIEKVRSRLNTFSEMVLAIFFTAVSGLR